MNTLDYVRTLLTELVRTPSTPNRDMSPILRAATASIEELGLEAVVHEDVKAVEATSGPGAILFNGHLDTVPVASGWTKGQGVWEGDWLYGRGAADMKAGCVAALAAARTLLDHGRPVALLFTTDEETSMDGAKKLAPTPLVRNAAAVVVGEPSGLNVIASEKGVLWFRAMTRGRSAHGSMPQLGDNAIHRMARILSHLEGYSRPRDVLAEVTVNVGRIEGGVAPNVVADACSTDLDCRHPPSVSKGQVEALLRRAFEEASEDAALELLHEVPAAEILPDAPHVRLLRNLAGTEVVGVTYGTEMAWFAQHNPRCVVFGPGETAQIHVPDERVSLAETVRAAEILVQYAEALRLDGGSSTKDYKPRRG